MQDIPKIVRERLKVAVPVDHPDTNALTAFAEHSLSATERNTVLVHLSLCVDCRDIVALALPPTEAGQVVITPSRGWLTWPVLRWGFVAAGVVAIASVGLVQYQRGKSESAARMETFARSEVVQEAKNQTSAPVPAAPLSEAPSKPEPSSGAQDKLITVPSHAARDSSAGVNGLDAPQSLANPALAHPSVHLPERGATVAGGSIGGPVQVNGVLNNGQFANQQQNNQWHGAMSAPQSQLAFSANPQAPAPASAPSAAQAVHVESCCADKVQAAGAELAQNHPFSPIPQDDAKVVTRSKEPEITTVEVASAAPAVEASDKDASRQDMPKAVGEPVNGRNVSALVALKPSSQLRWTINVTGSLQRSYDQGNTWQGVDVMAGLVPTSDFASYDANAVTSLAKAKTTKKEKRARKQDVASPVFRAVTATGSEVWAGGSNAALYHSTDAGDHWTRVVPSSGSVALTGDVVALEFPDSQHGKVTTSTTEVWTTADAGQTWQKQ